MQAHSLVMQATPLPVPTTLPLHDAIGCTLAQNIPAERDYPPFDRITHDGIALFFSSYEKGMRAFPVTGYAAAGEPQHTLNNNRHCMEVATGAPLPVGCDTVVPYEQCTITDAVAHIHADVTFTQGSFLHRQGSDCKQGDKLLTQGCKIGIHEIAVLAANGFSNVSVYAKPAIGILATGNELVAVEDKLLPHQIRRSNDVALQTALALNGFTHVESGWVPDEKERITDVLAQWLESKRVIVITGGVSRGSLDYVPEILGNLGVEKIFHRVAQRPGKPLWFGKSAGGTLVFGLPGNPVSCLTCLTRYVLPALRQMAGELQSGAGQITLREPCKADESLTLFTPIRLQNNQAEILSHHGSGDFISLLGSDGFIQVQPLATQNSASFYPWVSA